MKSNLIGGVCVCVCVCVCVGGRDVVIIKSGTPSAYLFHLRPLLLHKE